LRGADFAYLLDMYIYMRSHLSYTGYDELINGPSIR
jgi:hypothetical protein